MLSCVAVPMSQGPGTGTSWLPAGTGTRFGVRMRDGHCRTTTNTLDRHQLVLAQLRHRNCSRDQSSRKCNWTRLGGSLPVLALTRCQGDARDRGFCRLANGERSLGIVEPYFASGPKHASRVGSPSNLACGYILREQGEAFSAGD